MNKPKNITKIE